MTGTSPNSQIIKKLMVDLLHLVEMLKEELKFNLFNVSQMRDKKNNVLFSDTECVVFSPDFKLLDESQVLLKVPRNNNMYSFDLKNDVPVGGRKHALSFMRPFGCPVTILNTLDHLEENLHINFLENKPNVAGTGPNWMFDIDTLTMSMNINQFLQENELMVMQSSENEDADDAGKKGTEVLRKENGVQDPAKEGDNNDQEKDLRDQEEALRKQCEQEFERLFGQGEADNTNNTNRLNIVSSLVNVVSSSFTTMDPGRKRAQRNEFESMFGQDKDANGNKMFTPVSAAGSTYDTADLQDTGIFSGAYDDEVKYVVADFNNLELTTVVSPIPTTRIHKDHPKEQIIRDSLSAPQTKRMTKTFQEHAMVSYIKKQRTNHKDYQNCLFACFLSQIEPKKVIQALTDPSWIKAMQDELLQFRLQKVWRLVDLPKVYTSCIEQLWATAKVKNINGEAQIQALVDKMKVIITTSSIKRDIRFEDEGGVDCLSNEVIFEQLTRMGSTMASAIICLATNKKFNFSKYIFDNMVKHLNGEVKFLMYPRFVQVFLDNQVEALEDMSEDSELPTDSHHTPIVTQPSSSLPQKKQKSRRKQRKEIEVPSPSSEIPNEERLPTT
nr:putative ribonuclease H-like domain-containing protein [Tanacetum cinerariifolium]